MHIDLVGLSVFLFFLSLSLICLNSWLNKTEYTITKGKIISRNKLRKKVIENIKGYNEETYTGKFQSGEKLIFCTEKRLLTIDSNPYLNFHELAEFTRNNFKKLPPEKSKKHYLRQYLTIRLFFFFAGLGFIALFLNTQFGNEKKTEKIQITLSENLKIEEQVRKRKYKIRINTLEYPEFNFNIGGDRFRACNIDLIDELKKGDQLEIGLKSEVLHSKLLKSYEPSFMTNYFNWKHITVYQLIHKNKDYINQNTLKKSIKLDKIWSWFVFLIPGLFFLFISFVKTKN